MFSPASLPIYDRAKGPSQALYGLGMDSLMTGQEKVLGRENIPTYCRSLASLNMPLAMEAAQRCRYTRDSSAEADNSADENEQDVFRSRRRHVF